MCDHEPRCSNWITADSRRIPMCCMAPEHLAAALRMAAIAVPHYKWLANAAARASIEANMASDGAVAAAEEFTGHLWSWEIRLEMLTAEQARREAVLA